MTQIGTIVYQNIEAIDKDLPNKPNSQISYSIQDGNCSVCSLIEYYFKLMYKNIQFIIGSGHWSSGLWMGDSQSRGFEFEFLQMYDKHF